MSRRFVLWTRSKRSARLLMRGATREQGARLLRDRTALAHGTAAGRVMRAGSTSSEIITTGRLESFGLASSNTSIERSFQSPLRALWAAAHVAR